jgi:hypothetical protein
LLHRPAEKNLWDTWIFIHPETSQIHLFYLVREDLRQPCRWIYHAVSDNWLDWQPVEVLSAASLGSPALGTGMVFCADGDYYMTTTGGGAAGQSIWLFLAGNQQALTGWQAVVDHPVITPEAPWYETNEMPLAVATAHCRDAFVVTRPDAFHALIAMRASSGAQGGRGCVGHAVSMDLRSWQLRPPLFWPGNFYQAEVPDYFEWNGWHYILFNDASWFQRHDTPARSFCTGTFYAMSERFEGPYRVPSESLLQGAGNLRFDGYVARQLTWGDQRLLYFHHTRPLPCLGLPKLLHQQANGELYSSAWNEGIRALRAGPELHFDVLAPFLMGPVPAGAWMESSDSGEIHAECEIGNHHALWANPLDDFEISATIRPGLTSRAGIVVRFDLQRRQGILVSLDRQRGECALERISEPPLHHPFCRTEPLDSVRWPVGEQVDLRIIVRADFLDAYIDGRLAFSAGLAEMSVEGQAGLFVADGKAAFKDIHAFGLCPLVPTIFE